MVRHFAYRLLVRQLRRVFRRIVWRGPWAPPPSDRPLVLYANHHAFFDAQVLGFLTERVLKRRTTVWMEELVRFPFLAALGAAPFPADNPARRIRTVRRTIHLMRREPTTALIYFPEAHLHPVESGVLAFPNDRLGRLAAILPSAYFWPVALRVSGWHEATPTAILTGGDWHERPTGDEREELERLLRQLDTAPGGDERILLDGRPGPNERWDFAPLGRLLVR